MWICICIYFFSPCNVNVNIDCECCGTLCGYNLCIVWMDPFFFVCGVVCVCGSNARSTHKKLRMKIVNFENEKKEMLNIDIVRVCHSCSIIIDRKKTPRRAHTTMRRRLMMIHNIFLRSSWLTKDAETKRKLYEKNIRKIAKLHKHFSFLFS